MLLSFGNGEEKMPTKIEQEESICCPGLLLNDLYRLPRRRQGIRCCD
jgi:hypothetical protein